MARNKRDSRVAQSTASQNSDSTGNVNMNNQETTGPLMAFAEKATSTAFVRSAENKVPCTAQPAVACGKAAARRLITTVDSAAIATKGAFQTDEGKQLISASCTFFSSLLAFLAMISSRILDGIEKKLQIEQSEDGGLGTRCVRVTHSLGLKFSNVLDRREKKVKGTSEAKLYFYIKSALRFLFSVLAMCLNSLAVFSGPGSNYIAPAAESAIRSLPSDVQNAIRQHGDMTKFVKTNNNGSTGEPNARPKE